ncbi:MAG: hypothetical protein ABSG74_10760 [Candidatus Bathyarchaeia archaeon]
MPAKVQSVRFVRYSGLLSDAVDEGLAALGQLPKDAIYEALKTNFSMQKEDIPARFAEFSNILRDNIGLSAEPLLGFIIDRFCREIRIESMSSIDLDESISRVHMIVKGDHAKGDHHDRGSRKVPVPINSNAADEIRGSARLMRNQTNPPRTETAIIIKTGSRGQSKRMQNRTPISRRSRPNSTT